MVSYTHEKDFYSGLCSVFLPKIERVSCTPECHIDGEKQYLMKSPVFIWHIKVL